MSSKDYYSVLGLGRDATQEDIKEAYRRMASKFHPDRFQGDDVKPNEDEFKKINEAYGVLGDLARRAKYDTTGDVTPFVSVEDQACSILLGMFQQALDAPIGFFLANVRASLHGNIAGCRQQLSQVTSRKPRLLARRNATGVHGEKNLVHMLIDQQIRQMDEASTKMQTDLRVFETAAAMLDTYHSTETQDGSQPQMPQMFSIRFSSGG